MVKVSIVETKRNEMGNYKRENKQVGGEVVRQRLNLESNIKKM